MSIAFLGWGSLVWEPRELPVVDLLSAIQALSQAELQPHISGIRPERWSSSSAFGQAEWEGEDDQHGAGCRLAEHGGGRIEALRRE